MPVPADTHQVLRTLLADLAPTLPANPALQELATELVDRGLADYSPSFRFASPLQGVPLVQALAVLLSACQRQGHYRLIWHVQEQLTAHLRRKLALSEADLLHLFEANGLAGNEPSKLHDYATLKLAAALLRQTEHLSQATGSLPTQLAGRLQWLLAATDGLQAGGYLTQDLLKLRTQALAVLSLGSPDALPVVRFASSDVFGRCLTEFVAGLVPGEPRTLAWLHLLQAMGTASGGRPTASLAQALAASTATLGADEVREQGGAWLALLAYEPLAGFRPQQAASPGSQYLQEANQPVAKGLVWALAPLADAPLLQQLADLALRCLRPHTGHAPLAMSLGNAALLALSQGGLPGLAHLAHLRPQMAQENSKGLIDGYLTHASAALGVSPAEVEDWSVPDFGLHRGSTTFAFGDYHATLALAGGKADVQWAKSGKPLKTAPAALKTTHPTELRVVKAIQAQAQQTYTTQRDRLDRSFLTERRIPWPQFAKYYLAHGLLGELVRPLIWRLHHADGSFHDALYLHEQWQDAHGQPVPAPLDTDAVQLWHPVLAGPADVLAWRALLEKAQVRQPLKQAYREVYLLTPPEERTRMYSNRMAAHILKQHQFSALARGRGWQYRLMGNYDKGYESDKAKLDLPAHGLQAQFWVSEVNADGAFNDTGMWNYVSTDQVRFVTNHGPVPLPEVPPLAFSEVMRDVDLFVGVASVGNDPAWRDNGRLLQYRTYWESFSFGELGEVAKNRKLILERLVPRLKIAKVSEIRDKFLVVRGKRRTYKIHLGSGNILMELNDQYLCIVPDRSTKKLGADDVFLPFEGDAVLSIILSKALLLMDDDKITDETILRQIN
ncbi:MAG: DUF4132 domain-containing protein [Janthinobacterium lividum]